MYKARAEVECTFTLLKQARRFATREKTLRNYGSRRHRLRAALVADLGIVDVIVIVDVVAPRDRDRARERERHRDRDPTR